MEKVLKPFVVLSTYVVLYAVTYSFVCLLISATFWINYFDVVHSIPMCVTLFVGVLSHLCWLACKVD